MKYPIPTSILIDSSSMSQVMECPRKAEYYILRKREPSEERMALVYGKAVHLALANIMTGDTSKTPEQVQAEYKDINTDDWRTMSQVFATIRAYETHYLMDSFELMHKDGKPLVEIPFAIPLGELHYPGIPNPIPVIWQGRVDSIVSFEGRAYVMDHKTCSVFQGTYFDAYRKSAQMIGYTWAAQQILGPTQRVEGSVINLLISRKPTKTGTANEFKREIFVYSDEDIHEWKENILATSYTWFDYIVKGNFPMYTKQCVGQYGRCPYYDVCHTPKAHRETVLTSNLYKDVTWSPFKE